MVYMVNVSHCLLWLSIAGFAYTVFGGGSALTGKFASVTRTEPRKEGDDVRMMCEVRVCTCAYVCVF